MVIGPCEEWGSRFIPQCHHPRCPLPCLLHIINSIVQLQSTSTKMSGIVEIKSPSEWQSLLSGTSVVVADCMRIILQHQTLESDS